MIDGNEFITRRERLFASIGVGDVVILCASSLKTHDSFNNKVVDSYFYYFTGFQERDAVAIFIAGVDSNEYLLFHSGNNDATVATWHGMYISAEDVVAEYGASKALPIKSIDELLPQLLLGCKKLYFNSVGDDVIPQNIMYWLERAQLQSNSSRKLPAEFLHVGKFANEMRLYKSTAEIEQLRKAASITVSGVMQAMQVCRSGMFEYELEAELLYVYTKSGGCTPAFKAIVGSGSNACVLHYEGNNALLSDGDLVLIDTGATYNHYHSDVSRTFPISGQFNAEQRAIYQAVLDTQSAVIAAIAPGVTWDALQTIAERVITEQLLMLGILSGEVAELLVQKACKPFFMHNIGHWLGLDVHDVGAYQLEGGAWRVLEPSMVFTVEPGIYIAPNQVGVASKWWGIGVRVEDVVVVTVDGCEVLTATIPKTISAVEGLLCCTR